MIDNQTQCGPRLQGEKPLVLESRRRPIRSFRKDQVPKQSNCGTSQDKPRRIDAL